MTKTDREIGRRMDNKGQQKVSVLALFIAETIYERPGDNGHGQFIAVPSNSETGSTITINKPEFPPLGPAVKDRRGVISLQQVTPLCSPMDYRPWVSGVAGRGRGKIALCHGKGEFSFCRAIFLPSCKISLLTYKKHTVILLLIRIDDRTFPALFKSLESV
jgi:hypothetical protein